jgi:glyoxylase I family protein
VTSAEGPERFAPITGLSHFQLLVTDVGASARWYSTALGLVPYAEDLEIGYVALKHREAKIVVVLTKAGHSHDGPPGPADQVVDHLAFSVSDGDSLQAWAEYLTSVGIEHAGVVLENGHPSLQLLDPDGVSIELVAP